MGNAATGEADRGALLDDTALAATIDVITNGTARDAHIRPNVGSELGLVIFNTVSCKSCCEECIARTTAGTIDVTTDRAALNIHSSIRDRLVTV